MPKLDASRDYLIRWRCFVRDLNAPQRRCPAPGMKKLGTLDHLLRIRYAPVDRCQLWECRRHVSCDIKMPLFSLTWLQVLMIREYFRIIYNERKYANAFDAAHIKILSLVFFYSCFICSARDYWHSKNIHRKFDLPLRRLTKFSTSEVST